MTSPTLINLNLIAVSYHTFTVNQDKCNKSCNAVDDSPIKTCTLSKTKEVKSKYLIRY